MRGLIGSLREARAVRRALTAVSVDLVHVQSAGGELTAFGASLRRPRIPVVSTIHVTPGYVAGEVRESVQWRLLCWLNMRSIDSAIGVCAQALESWNNYPGAHAIVRRGDVVYNGCSRPDDGVTREAARHALGIRSSDTVLLNIGAYAPVKGQLYLLEALRRLRDEGVSATLLLVGGGSGEGTLRESTEALGLSDHVRFLGFRDDKWRLLAAADVYVQSSLQEAFPMVLLEAGQSGVPIVATDVGGVSELVANGVSGTLVEPGDSASLARGIGAVIADPPLAHRMAGQLLADIHSRFMVEHMIEQTARIYRDVVKRSARAPLPTL